MTEPLFTLRARLAVIEEQSYYEILRVPSSANPTDVKAAFHEFALACHPDQYVDEPPDVSRAAGEVFKRGVEAYKVLTKVDWRAKYDEGLLKGKLRFVPGEAEKPPPPPPTRTLEEIAKTPRAKQFALKADRLISAGKLDEARVALVTAMQDDYNNEELKERLNLLYEALALEPL
jgi:curved DNA-binding protein CbpA